MEAIPIIFALWLKWHFLSFLSLRIGWRVMHSRPFRYLCNIPFKEGGKGLLKTLQSKEIESSMTFSAAQIVLNIYSCLWTFVVFYLHLCPYIENSCLWFYSSTLTLEFCMFDISCDVHSDVGCFIDLYFLHYWQFKQIFTSFFVNTSWLLLSTEVNYITLFLWAAKLKDMGNSLLGRFGMSVDNFKAVKDPNTGSYSVSFQR